MLAVRYMSPTLDSIYVYILFLENIAEKQNNNIIIKTSSGVHLKKSIYFL